MRDSSLDIVVARLKEARKVINEVFDEVIDILDQKELVEDKDLSQSVDILELSIRTQNCLYLAGVLTIGKLLRTSKSELLKIKKPRFGKRSLCELERSLSEHGFKLKEEGT